MRSTQVWTERQKEDEEGRGRGGGGRREEDILHQLAVRTGVGGKTSRIDWLKEGKD